MVQKIKFGSYQLGLICYLYIYKQGVARGGGGTTPSLAIFLHYFLAGLVRNVILQDLAQILNYDPTELALCKL